MYRMHKSYKMEYLFWSLTCCLITTMLIPSSRGITFTAVSDENKVFNWTIDPLFSRYHRFIVRQPTGRPLLIARGRGVSKVGSNQRVIISNKTNLDTGHIEFTLNNVTTDDAGDYWIHTLRDSDRLMPVMVERLVVFAKPSTPNVTELSPLVVGGNMSLSCVTNSNSKPDNDEMLQMMYTWYRNGTDLPRDDRHVSSGSELQIEDLQRSDGDTVYTCQAYETESLTSDVSTGYTVVLQHGPDPAEFSPPIPTYNVLEGDSLTDITCTSNCNPECSYRWTRNGNQVSNGQVLNRINNIKRGQAGQYLCIAGNEHGSRETSITVVVQYMPDKPVLSINSNTADVTETSPISFQCSTQSVPSSNMKIYGENMTTLNAKDDTVSNTHITQHSNCLDSGIYYCSAENSIGKSVSSGRSVNVLCKPRSDHRLSQDLRQVLALGESMNISGKLISNPLPTVYWTKRLGGSAMSTNVTNNIDGVVIHNTRGHNTIISQVIRTTMREDDFGEYVMHALNDYGQSTMVFTVMRKTKPNGPTMLEILCKANLPVQITFAPDFDGGCTQVFTLGMRTTAESEFTITGDNFTDNGGEQMTILGPKIDVGVVYFFAIYASNSFGTTESTTRLGCSIENESQGGEDIYQTGIALIVVGLIFILAAIGVGIWCHLRRLHSANE